MMVKMVGNPLAHELTDERLRELYGDRLSRMPGRVELISAFHDGQETVIEDGKEKRRAIWKPIDEILKIADNTDAQRLSKGTIARQVQNVSAFLRWAIKKKHLQAGLPEILDDLATSADIKKAKGTHFTDEELKALFENDTYRQGMLFKHPYRCWIPLMLLYTGARLGEISQLRIEDVHKEDGIWVFYIRDYREDTTVKSEYSIRTVPVHKDLIDRNFLKFYEQRRDSGEAHLFPVLSPSGDGNHWGRAATRWFSGEKINGKYYPGYMEKCGISKQNEKKLKRNLHSFRYTFITKAKRIKLDWDMRRELTGHTDGKKVDVHTGYEGEYEMKDRKRAVDKIDYGLNVAEIRKWR